MRKLPFIVMSILCIIRLMLVSLYFLGFVIFSFAKVIVELIVQLGLLCLDRVDCFAFIKCKTNLMGKLD